MVAYARQVSSALVEEGDVITAELLNTEYDYLYGTVLLGGIRDTELASDAVTEVKIKDDAVTTDKIKDANVTEDKLEDGAVTVDKLGDDEIPFDKIDTSGAWSFFGTWATKDSTPATFSTVSSIYLAETDGFVMVKAVGTTPRIYGYTDSSSSAATLRTQSGGYGSSSPCGLMMPVKEGEYWKVTKSSGVTSATIYWLPIGTGDCVKQ